MNPGRWVVGECGALGRGRLSRFCLGDVCDCGGADCFWSGGAVAVSSGWFLVSGVGFAGTRSETAVGASLPWGKTLGAFGMVKKSRIFSPSRFPVLGGWAGVALRLVGVERGGGTRSETADGASSLWCGVL